MKQIETARSKTSEIFRVIQSFSNPFQLLFDQAQGPAQLLFKFRTAGFHLFQHPLLFLLVVHAAFQPHEEGKNDQGSPEEPDTGNIRKHTGSTWKSNVCSDLLHAKHVEPALSFVELQNIAKTTNISKHIPKPSTFAKPDAH